MDSTTTSLLVFLGGLLAYWLIRKTKGPIWFSVKVVVALVIIAAGILFVSYLSGESGRGVIEAILGFLKGILWGVAVAFRGIAHGLFWLHDQIG